MSNDSNEVVIVLVLILSFIILAAGGLAFYQFRSQRAAVERAIMAEHEARLMAERAAEAAHRATENAAEHDITPPTPEGQLDADFAKLTELWASLDDDVKARIMELANGRVEHAGALDPPE